MEKTKVMIRPANAADTDRIWRLWKAVVDQKVYFPYDETYTREQIEAVWINFSNAMYVAEIDGDVIGAYILKPNQPGRGAHVANAAYMVDATHRGKGVGSKLCAHSLTAARELHYRGMQFNMVVSTNENGIRVWRAHGFQLVGTIPGGFRHPELGYVDSHIFYKDLTVD